MLLEKLSFFHSGILPTDVVLSKLAREQPLHIKSE